MLVISNRQMKQLSTELEARYVRESVAMLRGQYPAFEQKHPSNSADEFVRDGIKKAKRYRIIDGKDTSVFLKYLAALGPDFAEQPEHEGLRRILLVRNLGGREKIGRMLAKFNPDIP